MDQVMITVPHIVQKFRWDCGLACSQMVLRFADFLVHNRSSFMQLFICMLRVLQLRTERGTQR